MLFAAYVCQDRSQTARSLSLSLSALIIAERQRVTRPYILSPQPWQGRTTRQILNTPALARFRLTAKVAGFMFYRGTSCIRNSASLGPYNRTMPTSL